MECMRTPGKLKVIHAIDQWLPHTENWLYQIICSLPEEVESTVVCSGLLNADQFPVPRLYQGKLSELAVSAPIDIIHSHFGDTGWRNIQAVEAAGSKHVVSFYGYDLNLLPRMDSAWLTRYQEMFEHADAILCEGTFMRECLLQLGCPAGKAHVHHIGVDLSRIPLQPRIWQRGHPLKVLIAGSFREKKGIPYAIEALARIKDEVNLEITVIGDAVNHDPRMVPEKQKILRALEDGGLSNRTRLLGYQPLQVLYKEAYGHHLFISPSITAKDGDAEGGAPVVIIEMAASGMPIVSTSHCDIPGVVGKKNRTLLVSERDVDALADQIRLWTQMESWVPIITENRSHIQQHFSAVKQGIMLGGLYERLLDRRESFV